MPRLASTHFPATSDMTVRLVDGLPTPEAYHALFETTGWNAMYRLEAEQLAGAISRSWHAVSAYEDDALVGFGRAISDGTLYAVVFDMIVAPKWQRRGIGTAILERLLARCDEVGIRDVLLFSAQGTAGFYRRFGFIERPAEAPGMLLRRTA